MKQYSFSVGFRNTRFLASHSLIARCRNPREDKLRTVLSQLEKFVLGGRAGREGARRIRLDYAGLIESSSGGAKGPSPGLLSPCPGTVMPTG